MAEKRAITIYPPIEIFDDPDYCNGKEGNCGKLGSDDVKNKIEAICYIYPSEISSLFTVLDTIGGQALKCDQCKDLYKQSKEKEKWSPHGKVFKQGTVGDLIQKIKRT